jgi:hypothetical protein
MSYIFWDVTPCSSLKNQPTFRNNMSPPTSESRISQRRNHLEISSNHIFEDRGECSSKHQLTFNGLHEVMSKKSKFCVTIAVTIINLVQRIIFLKRINSLIYVIGTQ